jgi:hypothetical protein
LSIPAILIREESSERRRDERWRVRLGARWLDCGPDGQALTILDLSTSGFCVEVDQQLKVGSHLIVEMQGGVNKICKTVWNTGKLHGALFSEPLSEIELQDLIASDSAVLPSFGSGVRVVAVDQPAEQSSEIIHDLRTGEGTKRQVAIRLMTFAGVSAALSALAGVGIWLAFT